MLRFVAVPYILRLRGGEPPGGDGHLNPHHGREHEHQHPLRGVPLDGRHTGEDRHGILKVGYTVTKKLVFTIRNSISQIGMRRTKLSV
jgi:hypothetical protein